jgi:hypothetical protein
MILHVMQTFKYNHIHATIISSLIMSSSHTNFKLNPEPLFDYKVNIYRCPLCLYFPQPFIFP